MFLYDKIDNWYPQARFVLTVRDSEALAKSDIAMLKRLGHSKNKIHSKDKIIIQFINCFRS